MLRKSFAALAIAGFAAMAAAEEDAAAYYLAIQPDPPAVVPADFAELERAAYENFREPSVYPPLVDAFAGTSERVWALVYGEVHAGITDDEAARERIGKLLFRLYEDAVQRKPDDSMSVSLTRRWNVAADHPELPFEMQYELSATLGLVAAELRPGSPVTIGMLDRARREQVSMWREKGLPETELLRWQERILQSGHFTPYNHWLFAAARPDEFEAYRRSNRAGYEAWLAWRRANSLKPDVPDFQRPLLGAPDPELELLAAGRRLLQENNPVEALRKSFDVAARRLDARHAGGGNLYCARDEGEALYYLALASAAKQDATVLSPTWSDAHYLKGYALLELGRLRESREALERAVSLSPRNSVYLSELAYTHQVEKDWDAALAGYVEAEDAAGLSPEDVAKSDASRALRGQGFALVELDRLDDAEAVYRKAMETDPDDKRSAGELRYIEEVRRKRD